MEPLRILFITPYIPSLIRVRPYNLIKYLAGLDHRITLLALEPPGEDRSGLASLNEWCQRVITVPLPRWRTLWNGIRAIPGRTPLQAAYSRSPEMAQLIGQIQSEASFDVAHVEHLRGAELSVTLNGIPAVFDSVDAISLLFEQVRQSGPNWRSRLMAGMDLARTRAYEGGLLERFPRVLVTSPHDCQTLTDLSTVPDAGDRLTVLPNGVDLDYFKPLELPRKPATVIFSGKMSYHANIAAAMDLAMAVMPLVWEQLPNANLTIAGKDPSAELQALASDPRITVTGTVPDLRPYLAQATVSISPMRYGVGIQNKVLEAMAMGTPSVTTSQTTMALQVQAGKDLLVADTSQGLAQAVVKLLADDELARNVGQAGRQYVETHHDWNRVAKKLDGIYRQVVHSHRPQ